MDAIGERPIIAQPLALGNSIRTQWIRQRCQITFIHVEENIVAVPMLNPEVCDDFRTHAVHCDVAALAKLFPPILKGLLVDVVFTALAGDRSRKHHKRAVRR